jgi:superfamily II DNA/RNA helicase
MLSRRGRELRPRIPSHQPHDQRDNAAENNQRQHEDRHWTRLGYTTCENHGGMNPHERKRAQEEFRTSRQICVATEAASEGINLQFCRLMINYDLPWNPTRLEQRLGRTASAKSAMCTPLTLSQVSQRKDNPLSRAVSLNVSSRN